MFIRMKTSVIKNRINQYNASTNVIVLKGFSTRDVLRLADDYILLDQYILDGTKIDLSKIQPLQLLQELMKVGEGPYIMTYESFLDLTLMMRDLRAFKKTFYILKNNLLQRYENPTTESIPDFDSSDFQNDFSNNKNYAKYYSFCVHVDNKEYIQYIKYYIDNYDNIEEIDLFPQKEVKIIGTLSDDSYITLAEGSESLYKLLEDIYYNRPLLSSNFIIEKQDVDKEIFQILQGASSALRLGLKFHNSEESLKVEVRQDLYKLMEQTWGYKDFRNLTIYENLNINRNITTISQGEIIESVVREAEKSILKTGEPSKNVLLTSPTGAGKSLLFQLASIYLGEKHNALSIIVSPLVALMNDQVDNLIGSYKKVATLNGNIPMAEKETVAQRVKSGEINILYLAPELLLSYSITSFIGDRRIGLFVVDEAHTVTTWGRDFRVDYWFLGDYLRQSKRILGYSFPIFALTATAVWDPRGRNDMVFDIIRSLNMDPCKKYIGVVRRDDIHFDIATTSFKSNYDHNRNLLTIERIHEALAAKKKTIVYFPYKSTIRKIMTLDEIADISDRVTEYYSELTPAEKNLNAEDFKSGSKPIMCATKAYGMGIDVSDINMVYHHAPTGCLSDYVQEIGRVARDPNIEGIAKIDFSEHDFKFTRTLHGLSTIKSYQLNSVLKKLMALYKLKGEKRNMLIYASDFKFIFPGKNVDYDQKLKSCLLLISHDLLNKLRFNAIIVRPKNLFSKAYISVSKHQKEKFEANYAKFIKLVDANTCTYKVDIDEIWTLLYSNYSFANFKSKVAAGSVFSGFNTTITNKVDIQLNVTSTKDARSLLERFFTNAHKILAKMSSEHRRVSFDEVKTLLTGYSDLQKEEFVETFKIVYAHDADPETSSEFPSYCRIYNESFQLMQHGYERLETIYLKAFDQHMDALGKTFYCTTFSPIIKLAELLNSLSIGDYERLGGDTPAIFVRINNPVYLNDLVRKGRYSNAILNNIYQKYDYSERVFSYFFTQNMSDKQRWNFIEAYFLGASEEELMSIGNR